MVFKTVEVLVSLVANIAFVWLLFLHANCAGVGLIVLGVEDREGAVAILLQALILMAVSLVILQAVRIPVGFVCDRVSSVRRRERGLTYHNQ